MREKEKKESGGFGNYDTETLLVISSEALNVLKSLDSQVSFDPKLLPSPSFGRKITEGLENLSPQIVLLHGSLVSGLRYSPDDSGDIDIVLSSVNCAFFSLEEIYSYANQKLRKIFPRENIDVVLTTPEGLLSHIANKTSLGQSLLQGFMILHPR